VIVRDAGDAWHVVLQTDHADLSGACARQWIDTGARHASLVVAAERHDDGWAVWEQSPMMDAETGRPLNFLDVRVPAHLAFYRAGIAAITDEDSYAGLLVSMHGAGIYRQRYGTQPELKLSRADEVKDLVEAFVAEQEASHSVRRDEIGVTEEESWADYHRLQVYDRFSLFFCLKDLDAGESDDIGGFRLEPMGHGRVCMDPYPFLSDTASFTLLRRVLPKRRRTTDEFKHELLGTAAERLEIQVEQG
jgi:hypothetical protein